MPLVKVHVRRMVKKFPNNAPHSCFVRIYAPWSRRCMSRMARLVCSPNFPRSFLNILRLYHHFKPKASEAPECRDDTLKIKELRGAVHPEMMGNGGFDEAEPGVLNFFD